MSSYTTLLFHTPTSPNGIKIRALLDTGNSVFEAVAISEEFHKRLGVGFSSKQTTELGTASNSAKISKIGVSKPVKFTIEGINKEFTVTPSIVPNLSNDVNIGKRFLDNAGLDTKTGIWCHNGTTCLQIGNQITELIQTITPQTPSRGRTRGRNPASERSISIGGRKPELRSTEATTIPANSVMWISATTSRPIDESVNVMTAPHEDTYIEVPEAIYKWKGNTGTIAVLNLNEDPVRINKGSRIGYYTLTTDRELEQATETIQQVHEQTEPKSDVDITARKEAIVQELGLNDNPLLSKYPQLKKKAIEVVQRHWAVFGEPGKSIGKTDLIEFEVQVPPGTKPIKQRNRPLNPKQEESLKEQVKIWTDEGIIQPSSSPWASPLVPAFKKGGGIRWAPDYRRLNAVTVGDSFPVPNVETNLEKLVGSKIFSALDAASAYNVIPVASGSRAFLAFSTPWGLYEFIRMPWGTKNAGATYCRFVELMLDKLQTQYLIAYLDDLLIHTPNLEKHIEQLDQVLQVYEDAGIKLRAHKTKLFQNSAEYLGYVVTHEGIHMQNEYVQRIVDWPIPTTIKQLNCFLGFAGYYRGFIKEFSTLTSEMNSQRKNKTLTWTDTMTRDFQTLKECFLRKPIRSYPRYDVTEKFQVTTDFSAISIGGVLSQVQDGQERYLGSVARKTTKYEANYASVKGELAAVIWCFRKWEHLLRYRPFILNTDSSALRYINTLKQPSGIWFRWLQELTSYDFEVRHRPGRLNTNADALSRADHHPPPTKEEEDEQRDEYVNMLTQALVELYQDEHLEWIREVNNDPEISAMHEDGALLSREVIIQRQRDDEDINKIREWVTNGQKPAKRELANCSEELRAYYQRFEALTIDDGILTFNNALNQLPGGELVKRIVLPTDYANTVFHWSHQHPTAGHFGITATLQRARQRFYFHGMTQTLRRMTKACAHCVAKQTKVNMKQGKHIPQRNGYPLDTVNIDLVGPLPETPEMFKYILTVECGFTRYAQAYPLRNKEAATVAVKLMDEFICRYGMPTLIHSDNGKEFVNRIINELLDRLQIDKNTTPSYNPQSNPCERFHRTLNSLMRVFIERNDTHWSRYLPSFIMAYNTKVNAATQVTPQMAMFGREMRLPIDLVLPPPDERSLNEHVAALLQRTKKMYKWIQQQGEATIRRNASGYVGLKFTFKVGDHVLYLSPRKVNNKPVKITDGWLGPYRVTKRISEVLYAIQPVDYEGPEIIVHAARLILKRDRAIGRKQQIPNNLQLDDEADELGEEIGPPHEAEDNDLGIPVHLMFPDNEMVDLGQRNNDHEEQQREQELLRNNDLAPDVLEPDEPQALPEQGAPVPPRLYPELPEYDPILEPLPAQPGAMALERDNLEPNDAPMAEAAQPGPSRAVLPQRRSARVEQIRRHKRQVTGRPRIQSNELDNYLYGSNTSSDSDARTPSRRPPSKKRSFLQKARTYLEEGGAKMTGGESSDETINSITVTIEPDCTTPTKGTKGAAGYDLHAAERAVVPPGETTAIPLNLRAAIPEGKCLLLLSRSGLAAKGLTVQAGLIDSDYRGNICVLLHNSTIFEQKVEKNQRIAQGILIKTLEADFQHGKLPPTERGTSGFGSTGN